MSIDFAEELSTLPDAPKFIENWPAARVSGNCQNPKADILARRAQKVIKNFRQLSRLTEARDADWRSLSPILRAPRIKFTSLKLGYAAISFLRHRVSSIDNYIADSVSAHKSTYDSALEFMDQYQQELATDPTPLKLKEIELRRPYWQEQAMELFLNDYDDPKKFYETYGSASDLYYEVAHRLYEPDQAYRTMYENFMTDAYNNDHRALDTMITTLKTTNEAGN